MSRSAVALALAPGEQGEQPRTRAEAIRFHLVDEPTELSIGLLTRSLSDDGVRKGVSRKGYAHRSRVIRQQTERLAKQVGSTPARKHICARSVDRWENEGGPTGTYPALVEQGR